MDPENSFPQVGDPADINDDDIDEARALLDDARERLRETPAELVIVNHVMGLYELAAIHLSATPPDLGEARLAIDAVGYLVDGFAERLGEHSTTLAEALATIRMAYVQLSAQTD